MSCRFQLQHLLASLLTFNVGVLQGISPGKRLLQKPQIPHHNSLKWNGIERVPLFSGFGDTIPDLAN